MAKTKVTFEVNWDYDGFNAEERRAYSVDVSNSDMTIDEVFDDLLLPLLRAAGYAEESINGYFNGD